MTFTGLTLCVITIALGAANSAQSMVEEPPQCRKGLVVECSSMQNIVWALNDLGVCRPSLNRCTYNKFNCNRYRNNDTLLMEVPKAECQQNCIDCATTPASHVCAMNGGNACVFNSECDLQRHECTNAEMWSRELDRSCNEQKATSVCP